MSGKRKLTDEEHALWRGVTRSIAELRRRGERKEPEVAGNKSVAEAAKPKRPAKPLLPITPVAPSAPAPLAGLDRRLKQRIARGMRSIDDRIDLHGLTQEQAHAALRHFLRRAQAKGASIVLVITGKGGPSRGDGSDDSGRARGVLKRQVPLWLRQTDFRAAVIGFETAGMAHGGEGALYVRLRKARA